ncbi:Hpt domain-containing protein [Winogradskyella sp.]|jgi:HPt (histidine-containing phosphotransfer) domain-containing protein|uniref:Hpt domain-containing protein n=1 Tax=Winogradskyella sp. TaxID=1883156 RepID=UPI0025DE9DFF|nr:Hpt domain-containing protein [Winogradskyella sp.]MCT4630365.1 Hpt domain-containing protein [Winogradskyella sp.]
MDQPNLSYIESMSGGDKAFEKKLIDIIKQEFPEEKAVYFNNINAKNFKKAAENVHKIKHKISILGLTKSYDAAAYYENNLTENSTEGKVDFENTLQIMTDFLETI